MFKRLSFLIYILFISQTLAVESLYVFVPTQVRANILQEKIGGYCDDVDVTVFSRAKDFHKKVKSEPPSAILSLLPVVERTISFDMAIEGIKGGLTTENYVLVSIANPLKRSDLVNKKIGVVDLLGRKSMGKFIEQLFKTPVKLKRVTKVEDLLPLITFGSVDAIFIANSLFEKLKSTSNLDLVATHLNIKIGLASAALKGVVAKDKLTRCVFAFDQNLNITLGVDKWHTL